jgi:hypothetical protein
MSFLSSLKTEKQNDFLPTTEPKTFFIIGINLFGKDKPTEIKNTHENFNFGPWFYRSETEI